IRREMTQGLGREDERIVIKLPQILRRPLLQRSGAALRKRDAAVVRAVHVGGEVAADVRGADLQSRKQVERSLEDQVRERDGRVERVADHVIEHAVAFQAPGEIWRALRMQEDEDVELLALAPERMELRI